MAAIHAYTLQEATEMLTLCKTAYREIVSGQAKSYRVGTREYTSLNTEDLMKQIVYFSNLVEALSGSARSKT